MRMYVCVCAEHHNYPHRFILCSTENCQLDDAVFLLGLQRTRASAEYEFQIQFVTHHFIRLDLKFSSERTGRR